MGITNMDSQQTAQPVTSHMLLDHVGGETGIVSLVQSGNYEVVGEFPADFQFSIDISDQVGHYTEVYTEQLVNTEEVEVSICSEQLTLEEIADVGVTSEKVMVKNFQNVSNEKLVDNDPSGNHLDDDVEVLLEPSPPTRENPLVDEL